MKHAKMMSAMAGIVVLGVSGMQARAQTVFTDTFESDASALWSNLRGNWLASNGSYGATLPNNNPLTFTALPYEFTDFAVTTTIKAANDGGIWLRADAGGHNGVLLVLARGQIYWHRVVNDVVNPQEGVKVGAFSVGSDVVVQAVVSGNTYSAYLNGALTPTTTLSTSLASSGRVGLYDFTLGGHDFDDVLVQGSCVGGCCPALVSRSPASVAVCESSTTRLRCEAAGSPGFTYAWQVEDTDSPGGWRNVATGDLVLNGELLGTASGVDTADFALQNTDSAIDLARFRCIVTNSCGSATSEPAVVTIRQCPYGACVADFDASGGTPDSSDISEFFAAWLVGEDCADADCSGGTPDSSDIDAFFNLWLAGGC